MVTSSARTAAAVVSAAIFDESAVRPDRSALIWLSRADFSSDVRYFESLTASESACNVASRPWTRAFATALTASRRPAPFALADDEVVGVDVIDDAYAAPPGPSRRAAPVVMAPMRSTGFMGGCLPFIALRAGRAGFGLGQSPSEGLAVAWERSVLAAPSCWSTELSSESTAAAPVGVPGGTPLAPGWAPASAAGDDVGVAAGPPDRPLSP